MTCTAIRKYLYAFADGQLDVKLSCEVLDHLKMCPECSRLVEEHQTLRKALRKDIDAVRTPPQLRPRVLAALRMGKPLPADPARPWFIRLGPLAAAAVIVLVVGAAWWSGLGSSADFSQRNRPVQVRPGSRAAMLIAKVHTDCCSQFAVHHNPELPRDLRQLGTAATAHYRDAITALSPDFSTHGFVFESANFCGIRDKPNCRGEHIIYVSGAASHARTRLSFFSIPRWDCLDRCGERGIPVSDGLRQYEVEQENGARLNILAWHNDATTYIICADLPMPDLKAMVDDVRTAIAGSAERSRFAAAERAP